MNEQSDAENWNAVAAGLERMLDAIPISKWRPISDVEPPDISREEAVTVYTDSHAASREECDGAVAAWFRGDGMPTLSEPASVWLSVRVMNVAAFVAGHIAQVDGEPRALLPFPAGAAIEATTHRLLSEFWEAHGLRAFVDTSAKDIVHRSQIHQLTKALQARETAAETVARLESLSVPDVDFKPSTTSALVSWLAGNGVTVRMRDSIGDLNHVAEFSLRSSSAMAAVKRVADGGDLGWVVEAGEVVLVTRDRCEGRLN